MSYRIKPGFSRHLRLASLWLVVCTVLFSIAHAQPDPAPTVRGRAKHQATRTTATLHIDAILDEAAWSAAPVIELPYEIDPGENTPATARTEFRLLYDQDYLYIGIKAFDPDPSQIRARYADRDTSFQDDFAGVVIDTFNDERRGFEFFVNPLGAQMDLFRNELSSENNEDISWDAIWDSAGRIITDGYVIEMAIPFKSLRFQRKSEPQTWGIECLRVYPRDQRTVFGSHTVDRNKSCTLCQSEHLTGLENITPGRDLELDPTFTILHSDQRQDDGQAAAGGILTDPGVTAKWGITPNITLNATLNPDFSQIEADAAQLDINTQFALYYPEKRPFFLEGADVFETPLTVAFTRNVADPLWGLKLTGKEGRHGLGVFVAQDERTNLLIPGAQGSSAVSLEQTSTDAVLRYRVDVGKGSSLGAIATARRTDEYQNAVGGVDAQLKIADANTFTAQALGSVTEYPLALATEEGQPEGQFSGYALHGGFSHGSRDWSLYARYDHLDASFRADMGFVPRVGYQFALAGVQHSWYGKAGAPLTRIQLGADWDRTWQQDGLLLEHELEAWLSLRGPLQSFASLDIGARRRSYQGVFFDEVFYSFNANAVPSSLVQAGVSARLGDDIDYANVRPGKTMRLEPWVQLHLGQHINLAMDYTVQQLHVEGGRLFLAQLAQAKAEYHFNLRLFARVQVQYQDIRRDVSLYLEPSEQAAHTQQLFISTLFSYKLNPRTVVFVGYSGHQDDAFSCADSVCAPWGLSVVDHTFFAKLGYAWVL